MGIGRSSDDCGCAYKTDEEKAMGKVSISYTNEVVKDEQRVYLRTLPANIRLEYQLNHDKRNILFVYGSPRKVNEYLLEDRDEKSMLRIMDQVDADIMCFGHTHEPYHRILNSGTDEMIISGIAISAMYGDGSSPFHNLSEHIEGRTGMSFALDILGGPTNSQCLLK